MFSSYRRRILFVFLVGMAIGVLLCHFFGKPRVEAMKESVTTEVRYDTVRVREPVLKDSVVIRYVVRTMPIAEPTGGDDDVNVQEPAVKNDSVMVVLPIEQKVYEDEDYKAWVSGYMPQLDSISVYRRTTEVVRINECRNRWHIGVSAGCGLTPSRGVQPYVGIGITYSIISF